MGSISPKRAKASVVYLAYCGRKNGFMATKSKEVSLLNGKPMNLVRKFLICST